MNLKESQSNVQSSAALIWQNAASDSASVADKDYKFENETILGVRSRRDAAQSARLPQQRSGLSRICGSAWATKALCFKRSWFLLNVIKHIVWTHRFFFLFQTRPGTLPNQKLRVPEHNNNHKKICLHYKRTLYCKTGCFGRKQTCLSVNILLTSSISIFCFANM